MKSWTLLVAASLGLLACTPRYDGRDHLSKATSGEEAWKICRMNDAKLMVTTGIDGVSTYRGEFAGPATEVEKAAVGCLARWEKLHGNNGLIYLLESNEGKLSLERVDLSDYD
jgi:hypothetical protein